MATRFQPNPTFEHELAADPETVKVMDDFKQRALEGARAAAPVLTGRYRESLYVDEEGLGSTSSLWAIEEYGTVHEAPHAPLRRGVEAAGLEFTDAGR